MAFTIKFAVTLCIGMFYAFTTILKLILTFFKKGFVVFSGAKYRSRPEVLSDPRYGKSGFLQLKNITMHFVEKGDRSKPLLLLVHGFPEFWFSWRFQLDSKLSEEYFVVAIDMRGYGETDKPHNVSDYHIRDLTDDLKQAIIALGYTKCHLTGHDWGGAVSWAFANFHPEMVEKLVIMNCPHPRAFQESIDSSLAQFLKSWYIFMFQLPLFPEWLITRGDLAWMQEVITENPKMLSPSDLEAFKFTFSQPKAFFGPISYYRSAIRENSFATVGKIQAPTLIIFGAKDKYIGAGAMKLASKFCAKLDFESISSATHWVQQDEPRQVNQLMMDFLKN